MSSRPRLRVLTAASHCQVKVNMDVDANCKMHASVPAEVIKFGAPGMAFVSVEISEPMANMFMKNCHLTFVKKEVDPSTGDVFPEGEDEEYPLDEIEVGFGDYTRPNPLPDFRAAWDAMTPDFDVQQVCLAGSKALCLWPAAHFLSSLSLCYAVRACHAAISAPAEGGCEASAAHSKQAKQLTPCDGSCPPFHPTDLQARQTQVHRRRSNRHNGGPRHGCVRGQWYSLWRCKATPAPPLGHSARRASCSGPRRPTVCQLICWGARGAGWRRGGGACRGGLRRVREVSCARVPCRFLHKSWP